MSAKAKIEQILTKNFDIDELTVIDDSLSHADHNPAAANGGTHFNIYISSNDFEGKPLIKRHRMIYNVLKEELQKDLHALTLKTLTPKEANL